MKKEWVLFMTVLFAASQAVAQQPVNANSTSQTNNPSASTAFQAPKPAFHWFGPGEPVPTGNQSAVH